MQKREFTAVDEYRYNRSGPVRWIISHVLRYPWLPVGAVLLGLLAVVLESAASVLSGRTFDLVMAPGATQPRCCVPRSSSWPSAWGRGSPTWGATSSPSSWPGGS